MPNQIKLCKSSPATPAPIAMTSEESFHNRLTIDSINKFFVLSSN